MALTHDVATIIAKRMASKAIAMVEALDLYYRTTHTPPDPHYVAERLTQWTDSDWAELARIADIREPHESRALVIEAFRRRANRNRVLEVAS